MKIIALVKQVPDMRTVKFDRDRGVVDRTSAETEVNPFDLNALEAAVMLADAMGGETVAVSMGPPSAEKALKEAIARGVGDAVLLTDRKFGGSDTIATARILVSAINKLGNFDLIIAGEKTVDGDTGQVGGEIAGFLNIPFAAYVEEIQDCNHESITVASRIWGGIYVKRLKFPCLITVTKDVNIPKLPTLRRKLFADKAKITKWSFEELDVLEEMTGLDGSPTKVQKIEVPPNMIREGVISSGNTSDWMERFVKILKDRKIIE